MYLSPEHPKTPFLFNLAFLVSSPSLSTVPPVGPEPRADRLLDRGQHERQLPRRAARVRARVRARGGDRHQGEASVYARINPLVNNGPIPPPGVAVLVSGVLGVASSSSSRFSSCLAASRRFFLLDFLLRVLMTWHANTAFGRYVQQYFGSSAVFFFFRFGRLRFRLRRQVFGGEAF